jgi:nitroimidazol reductase NimA-like FMN-containing flavoprotein (pyridoxamine 5'-phosphate oxidase superfamily)
MQNKAPRPAQTDEFAELDEGVCLGHLKSENVGHLGLTSGALPIVTPIRYRLVGRSLVFATESGAKLTSARRNAVACLEIAGTEASTGIDWTVLATGRLREVTDPSFITAGNGAALRPWGLLTAEHVVALDIELLSGARSKVR